MHSRTRTQESGGNHGIDALCFKLVASDLLLYKNVVRLIFVKGADHVVSVHPGVGPVVVVLEAIGVRITRYIQPVPSPTLTVVQ